MDRIEGPQNASFRELLRFYREAAGLTQEELAEQAGLSPNTLSNLERGRNPSLASVRRLAAALDLTPPERTAFETAARRSGSGDPVLALPVAANHPSASIPFVGRAGPLIGLEAAFTRAAAGYGSLVVVAGELGIGKTALCEQFAASVVQRGGRVLWGHCYEESSLALPYLAFVEALRTYVQTCPLDVLRGQLGSTAPDVARIVPEIAQVLQLASRTATDPTEAHWRLLEGVSAFLRGITAVQPLVLILEDLHWADQATLDLLVHLARGLESSPLLVVGTYRDTDTDGSTPLSGALARLWRVGSFTRVPLEGLSPAEMRDLIDEVVGREVMGSFAAAVHRHTEGNPLFALEVTRYLIEEGRLAQEEQAWHDERLAPLPTPERLRDIVRWRLSRLRPECYHLLAIAAVIGAEFAPETLRVAAAVSEDQLSDVVDEAWRAALLVERGGMGDERYGFAHAVFQQTLYEDLSPIRRVRLHRQVAQVLEQQYAGREEVYAAELAGHLLYSSDLHDLRKAVSFAELAAQRAVAVYANEQALFWYDRAASTLARLAPDVGNGAQPALLPYQSLSHAEEKVDPTAVEEQWVRLLEGRAAVEVVLGRYQLAQQHLEAALARCEAAPQGTLSPSADRGLLTRRIPAICRWLARVHEALGDYPLALSWVQRGLTVAGMTWQGTASAEHQPLEHHRLEAARLCVLTGLLHFRRAAYDQAAVWAHRALDLAVSGDDGADADHAKAAQDIAQAYNLLGLIAHHQGRMDEAEHHCRESVVRYEALGDLVGADKAHSNLALVLKARGDFVEALQHYQCSQELAGRVGDPVRVASAKNCIGEVSTFQGNYQDALRCFAEALQLWEQHKHANFAAIAKMNMANAYLGIGEGLQALTLAQQAHDEFVRLGAGTHQAEVKRYLAGGLLLLGRLPEAEDVAAAALEAARQQGQQLEVGRTLRVLGQIQVAIAQAGTTAAWERSRATFAQSRDILEALGARYDLGLTLLEQARRVAAWVEREDLSSHSQNRELRAHGIGLAHSAAAIFEKSGAACFVAAAEDVMQTLGHAVSASNPYLSHTTPPPTSDEPSTSPM